MGKGAVGEKRGEGVKIVAISGATGGIGRALARAYAKPGVMLRPLISRSVIAVIDSAPKHRSSRQMTHEFLIRLTWELTRSSRRLLPGGKTLV